MFSVLIKVKKASQVPEKPFLSDKASLLPTESSLLPIAAFIIAPLFVFSQASIFSLEA